MTSDSAGTPVATIVITTHNRPDFAQRALRSALGQSIRDIEVVVVDDGSQPAFTPESEDDRVRVLRNARAAGVSAARNAGLGVARGEWVTFLDDDDELVPDMLERSIGAARRSMLPVPVAVMSAVTVLGLDGGEDQVVVPATELRRGEDYVLERRGSGGRAANSLVAPTAVMTSIGGFDEQLDAFQHDDLGLRLNAVASIQGVDDSLYRMTTHRQPRVSARNTTIPADMERTLAKHPEPFSRHRTAHARFMGTTGVYHLKAGNWLAAIRWSFRGLRRDPGQHRLWFFAAASLAGPHSLAVYRRVRPPGAGVSTRTLTSRRVRKYARRLGNYPRALVAAPLARVTGAVGGPGTTSTNDARSVLVLSVYRERNAGTVGALVDEAVARGWDVRLWALDRATPALAPHTIGTSSGAKFPLLNALANEQDLERFDWVVVADDDFVFRSGSIHRLLVVAEAAGLDLVQPAHTELSYRDNEIAVRRPLAVARRTSFVEIGPMFAVRRPWIAAVLPFPPEHAMGWGLELEWFDLMGRGAQLGVVDAVAIRHLSPVGTEYAKHEEGERLRSLLRARGLSSFRDAQRTIGTWRPWQATAPWVRRQYE